MSEDQRKVLSLYPDAICRNAQRRSPLLNDDPFDYYEIILEPEKTPVKVTAVSFQSEELAWTWALTIINNDFIRKLSS